jgi:exopolysaccharide production protein ExoZ
MASRGAVDPPCTGDDGEPGAVGNLGMFGVDIFFVISGFILGSTALRAAQGDPRVEAYDFMARRILRIFPIYWIVILFPLFRKIRLHDLTGFQFLDYWFLLPGVSSLEPQLILGLAWTLIFELVFYSVMALFMRFNLRHAVRNTIVALLILVVAGEIFGIRRPVLIIAWNPILLEFVLGVVTAIAFQKLGRHQAAGVGILAGGLIATGVLAVRTTYNVALAQNVLTGHGVSPRVATWGIAAWLLVSGVVFWGPQVKSGLGKVLVAIGDGSYSIYLTSAVSVEMIARLLAHVPPEQVTEGSILLREVVSVSAVSIAGMIFYWLIERPLGKRLHDGYRSMLKLRTCRITPETRTRENREGSEA